MGWLRRAFLLLFFFFPPRRAGAKRHQEGREETRHNHPVSSEGYDHHLLTARASSSTTAVVSAFCVSRSHEQAISNKTTPCTLFLRLSAPCFTALFILFSTTSLDPSPHPANRWIAPPSQEDAHQILRPRCW